MKSILKISLFAVIALASMISCSDDEFTASIYDTTDYPLDQTEYTFPLDSFVKREFLQPYNVKFIYRMEDVGSDMDKNLTPAPYEKSVQLAALSKWLWFDCYSTLAEEKEVFLKKYSPRIIHVIGSKNYNPTQGTETLGVAEGGIKISLYNVDNLNCSDIEMMNEYFFKTMHHEFGHILDQTHLRPTKFNLVSNGLYDSMGWTEAADSLVLGKGFVTPYASSQAGEDWVEVLANYVTRDELDWNAMLNTAKYEWEEVDCEDWGTYMKMIAGLNNLDTVGYFKANENGENKIYRRRCKRDANDNVVLASVTKTLFNGKVTFVDPARDDNPKNAVETWTVPGIDWTTVQPGSVLKINAAPITSGSAGNEPGFSLVDSDDNNVASAFKWDTSGFTMSMDIEITQDMLNKILATEDKSLTISGSAFIINKVELELLSEPEWLHDTGVVGYDVIMEKLQMVREWLAENYKIDIDELRNMVQERMYVKNPDGTWARDSRGHLVNRLTNPEDGFPRLIDKLTDEIYKLKK